MGIEAYIIPWLIVMCIIAIIGIVSLARELRTGAFSQGLGRTVWFWLRQATKATIVAFALRHAFVILQRVR